MTLANLINLLALVATCAIAVWRGRRPERAGALIIAAGFLLTPLVERRESWFQPQFGIFAVDVATLVALVALAFWYGRYWSICAAAFQAIAVLTHFAFLLNPHAIYRAYYFANFSIGFLLLGALLGGVFIESAEPLSARLRRPRHPGP